MITTLLLDSYRNYKLIYKTTFIPRVGDVVFLNGYPRNVTNVIWFSEPLTLKKHFFEIYSNCPISLPEWDSYEVIVYCGN